MKKLEEYQTRRFYIFKHTGSGENLKYRTGEGSWDDSFAKAELWSEFDHVLKKANQLFANDVKFQPDVIFVIGSAIIESDPYFEMTVIK